MVTIAGILLMVIFLVLIKPILTLFGATENTDPLLREYALQYGYIIGIGLPFTMISTALNSLIRADGSSKYAMFSMLLGAIINTAFDPIFIFVFNMGRARSGYRHGYGAGGIAHSFGYISSPL